MAIGVGSIVEARLFQRMVNQQILNVQHYFITAMETVSDDLKDYAEPMFNLWENTLSPLQHSALTWERCELYEVNGLDFGIYATETPIPGALSGEVLPVFVAAKVQLVRQTRATRHGWKRVAGMAEASANGDTLTPTYRTNLQNAINALYPTTFTLDSVEFPATRSITFQPIIWGDNDPAYPQGRYSAIANAVVSDLMTTQNTRKRGRGV